MDRGSHSKDLTRHPALGPCHSPLYKSPPTRRVCSTHCPEPFMRGFLVTNHTAEIVKRDKERSRDISWSHAEPWSQPRPGRHRPGMLVLRMTSPRHWGSHRHLWPRMQQTQEMHTPGVTAETALDQALAGAGQGAGLPLPWLLWPSF